MSVFSIPGEHREGSTASADTYSYDDRASAEDPGGAGIAENQWSQMILEYPKVRIGVSFGLPRFVTSLNLKAKSKLLSSKSNATNSYGCKRISDSVPSHICMVLVSLSALQCPDLICAGTRVQQRWHVCGPIRGGLKSIGHPNSASMNHRMPGALR